jgi:uncharacterized protein (TIGR03083 family)
MTLTDAELFAALDAAVSFFAGLPADRFEAPVPACPGWTLADLIAHQTGVHRWARQVVTTRPDRRPDRERHPLPPGADPRGHLAEGAEALAACLRGADLDEPVWTFVGERPARWWLRRQVHETTVHAMDAADAVGTAFPVRPEVAVDGVDEVVDFLGARFDAAAFAGSGETAHLHATDAPGEWLLRFAADGVAVSREHTKADVAARGPAADLLRLVWGRAPGPALETFGDDGILDRYRGAARF